MLRLHKAIYWSDLERLILSFRLRINLFLSEIWWLSDFINMVFILLDGFNQFIIYFCNDIIGPVQRIKNLSDFVQ